MTYTKHRLFGLAGKGPTVALILFLLAAICLQVAGAVPAKGPDGGGQGNSPGCHCCHGKVFLKLDKRYDLKQLVFLSTLSFQLVAPPVRRVRRRFKVSRSLASAVFRPAGLRGPPSC
jgi:hypothetical protein